MTLIAILIGTVAAGVGSVWLAALLSFATLERYTQHLLSLAAGALLATAFMNLLPEAFVSQADAKTLFAILLAGLVFFFLLDKAELWHHGHEHHHDHGTGHHSEAAHSDHAHHQHGHHHHGHHAHSAGRQPNNAGGWAVLAGDSVHAFGDGMLIASAFLADMRLGVVTAVAVLAHEVPHHIGDLVVLRHTSRSQRAAFIKVSMAGTVTAIGGLAGYFLLSELEHFVPFFLVLASSSFIYVALADLIPQLQRQLSFKETAAQVLWLAAGIAIVSAVSGISHGH